MFMDISESPSGKVVKTLQRAISKLEALGVVVRISTSERDRIYCAEKLMKILDEPLNF